ncbi:type I 3-dehydroquinate dehydratase [Dehalogenimonas etheniformans]|uniref:3-dehydroquinate dehydratase n=1 Tax=Dehalogenimonas etheniformans TaxID=1536648 RepID=A0A2P5P7F7_9CHLR|nr:type I 3-dehydroquinate dehydratase [Dehalogenimonas etheniformans]PPD58243.1 type I 3-dehydroquinate dehydratase [Dehalogenimonas etheniformans]QNT75652.1 type I 3-dehydroquinate dehydratase [Dehalogenimonas etheniformans]
MRLKICGVITEPDEAAIRTAAPLVNLFEVRIDLIGQDWPAIAENLNKPWIATNRLASQGGKWQGSENSRLEALIKALDLGASIVDLELVTSSVVDMIAAVKKKARCLISHHDFNGTPSPEVLPQLVKRLTAAGADICKLVTTANSIDDSLSLLGLYDLFPDKSLVAFAMGEAGVISRVMAPLCGAEFTYAALDSGQSSAPGQLTVSQLAEIYRHLKV